MNRLLLILSAIFVCFGAFAAQEELLSQLDDAILHKGEVIKAKEAKISVLKKRLSTTLSNKQDLQTLDDLYNEYHVFKFDSALVYAERGLTLARALQDNHYTCLFTCHKAEILAIGGLFAEAEECLKGLNKQQIDEKIRFKYYYTLFTVYSYWADYCRDQMYAPRYRERSHQYLSQALAYLDAGDPLYDFFQGERYVYVNKNDNLAQNHYKQVLLTAAPDSRPYAMAAFALAGQYRMAGDEKGYVDHLIKAALADVKGCTMENVALQQLALSLFENGDHDLARAQNYINSSLEDAQFYNNRLRILEISHTMPQIVTAYETMIKGQNRNLRNSVIFISLLVLGLLLTSFYIHRQNKLLATRRSELAANNLQLKELNGQLSASNQEQQALNSQLHELNQQLLDTNRHRETLASVCIKLCAKYIEKLNNYQTLVKRKIKAKQEQELLHAITSNRLSEEDASTFLHNFDKAFLELYPTFIKEFNALLQEGERFTPKSPSTMTTELRTFALIRLGVKSTADIAGLLFLSNQTIYNCRSVTKNKALNKDTFDEDVMKICTIIQQ